MLSCLMDVTKGNDSTPSRRARSSACFRSSLDSGASGTSAGTTPCWCRPAWPSAPSRRSGTSQL